ncbi:MAG: hypothetical protein M1812_004913 [Candelaria pacifica]|nr:MAG: hypothetical protein M1812_004913 [Candelaria pacifica]
MDWQPNTGFDESGYEGFYGAMDGIQRPQFATNPQDYLSYDDVPDTPNSWPNHGHETLRPLEERIGARPQALNHSAYQQNHSLYGSNGTVGLPINLLSSTAHMNHVFQGERIGNHQVHVPVTIPGISMPEPSPKPQLPGTFASTTNQNSALNSANPAMSEQARLEKAADLRAKLKASLAMRSGGTTPGRDVEPKDKANVNETEPALTSTKKVTVNNEPQVMTEIEGLFAEARAAAEAKDQVEPKEARDVRDKSANTGKQEAVAKPPAKRPRVPEKNEPVPAKKTPSGPSKEVKRRHNDSGETSEASELGEISQSATQQARSQAPKAVDRKKEMHSKIPEKNVSSKMAPSDKDKESRRDSLPEGGSAANKNRKNSDTNSDIRQRAVNTRSGVDQAEDPQQDAQFEQQRGRKTNESRQRNGGIGSPPLPSPKTRASSDVELAPRPSSGRTSRLAAIENNINERRPPEVLAVNSDLSPAENHYNSDVQPRKDTLSETGSYYNDLDDWLQMTGYHDQPYRKKALRRHKELIALEMQKIMLEREAQLEHEERVSFARAQSLIPQDGFESIPPRSTIRAESVRASSRISMPPPPLPIRADPEIRGQSRPPRSASAHLSTAYPVIDDENHAHYPQTPPGSSLKRRFSNSDSVYQERDPTKHARTDSGNHTDIHGPRKLETKSLTSPPRVQNGRTEGDERSQWPRTSRIHEDEDVGTRQRPRGPVGKASPPMAGLDRERSRSLSPLPPRMYDRYDRNDHRRLSEEDLRYVRHPQSPPRRVLSSRDSSPSYGRSYDSRAPPRSASYGYPERQDYKDDYVHRMYSDDPVRGSSHQSFDKYHNSSESSRGRGRGRGASYYSRGGGRVNKFSKQEHKGVDSLDLRRGG